MTMTESVHLTISDPDLLASYRTAAEKRGMSLEAFLDQMLRTVFDHLDEGIYIDKSGALEISRRLGNRVKDQASLLDMIRRLTTWNVGGIKIQLSPNQEEQIYWGARGLGKPIEEIGKMLIEEGIARRLRTR